MLGGLTETKWNNHINEEERAKVDAVIRVIGKLIAIEVQRRNLPPSKINGTNPSNVAAVLDPKFLHIVYERIFTGTSSVLMMGVPDGSLFSIEDVASFGGRELGMTFPSGISIPREILDQNEATQEATLTKLISNLIGEGEKKLNKPQAIKGFESSQPLLDSFSDDHPNFERNVFVAMRFADTPQNAEIWKAISETLASLGMTAHRADTKVYPRDDDLWTNVCVYMLGCKYGICVFEEIDQRDFNPNVQIEYGFMRATDRRVLLLKDSRQPSMPTDIVGKVYKPFDTFQITKTISEQVARWVKSDLGL
tara:strand:+ start:4667 stop:5590 length:924 start_codon:yes stop_codon:yes gene_type:complete